MKYDKEMEKYRNRLSSRSRRKRRKTDDLPPFWQVGWILEGLFLLALGVWLLTACAKLR